MDAAENELARYGPQPSEPSPFKRRCRLLQSWYRVEVLRQAECGPWRVGAGSVGSSLVDGHATGANFISPAAFDYAREKVEEKQRNPELTIDEFRLFNNMLSSQPMCFNLFADLRLGVRAGWPNATDLLTAMFAESRVAAVSSLDVEVVPGPSRDFIDDKTAFDALIEFTDRDGAPGVAAIETKYTDALGGNVAARQERKLELAARMNLFTADAFAWYADNGFDQLARNFLLTMAVAEKRGVRNAVSYVVGPREDAETPEMIERLRARLTPEHRERARWLPLEELVRRGLSAANGYFTDHLLRFQQRYLGFEQVAHLTPRRGGTTPSSGEGLPRTA